MRVRAIILGCGSSGGVPRIGGADGRGEWGACDPANPKNRRTRCSVLIQRARNDGTWDGELTTVLIDTAPELRLQMTRAGVARADRVLFTHDHADQTHGIDDLRALALTSGRQVRVGYDPDASPDLLSRFDYCFTQAPGSPYPAILKAERLPPPGRTFEVEGPSGPLPVTSFLCAHGGIPSLGFRVGPVAYSPDLSDLAEASWDVIAGAEVWIVDALRYAPHPTHAHLDLALSWIERAGVPRGVLTNLHIDMDHDEVAAATPAHVEPAHDGMVVEAG